MNAKKAERRDKRGRTEGQRKKKLGLQIFYWAFVCELLGSVMCIRFCKCDAVVIEL